MAFFEEVEARWLYVKNIGQRWWVVVAALWGMFWAADEIIAKWGSPPVKAFWETYTIRFPIDWKIAAVAFLVIFVLMLIEGGFRNRCQTIIAHEDALSAADEQHHKNLQSSLEIAEQKHRQVLQSALAASDERHRLELTVAQQKRRDWAGDWKELGAQFREIVKYGVGANWTRTSAGEQWGLMGSNDAARRVESFCKHAGDLLVASPKVAKSAPAEVLPYPPRDRWLYYLKATTGAFRQDPAYGVEKLDSGETFNVFFGSIANLAEISANACAECASQEY